jgi:peptide/nickel transport system ATP-binding protein
VLGQNGSGKSTLAHVLSGVTRPDAGSVTLWDKSLSIKDATRRRHGVQIVFQDPFSATSHRLTVLDTVCEPLTILKWEDAESRKQEAEKALSRVGLPVNPQFFATPCHALSGGQRQRVALARALAMKPRVLIADEITSMLDPSTRANLLRTLMGLQNADGFSMVFITHDLYLARKVADQVMILDQGVCVEHGPAKTVFTHPKHELTQSLIHGMVAKPESGSMLNDYRNIYHLQPQRLKDVL